MIAVTCRNGEQFSIDPSSIERIETDPDTVVHLVDGRKYVIDGLCPTVSFAISSASANVPARRYPRRSTALASPPTKITSPAWSRPCAPQYHM